MAQLPLTFFFWCWNLTYFFSSKTTYTRLREQKKSKEWAATKEDVLSLQKSPTTTFLFPPVSWKGASATSLWGDYPRGSMRREQEKSCLGSLIETSSGEAFSVKAEEPRVGAALLANTSHWTRRPKTIMVMTLLTLEHYSIKLSECWTRRAGGKTQFAPLPHSRPCCL